MAVDLQKSLPKKQTTNKSKSYSLSRLIKLLNRQIKEAEDFKTLLQGLINLTNYSLQPACCFIWLREDVFRICDDMPDDVMFYKTDLNDEDIEGKPFCTSAEIRPVANLKESPLRTTFLNAGVSLVVPMRHQAGGAGWLGLGPPQFAPVYTVNEKSFLEILADQGGLAIYCLWLKMELTTYVTQLQQAYRQTMQVQENERLQLVATLHDETLQHLADISVQLGLLRHQKEVTKSRLDDLHLRVAHADRCLREIVRGIHPAVLSDLGLIDAVITFFETVSLTASSQSSVQVELLVIGFKMWRLPDQQLELTLYRFIQNAATNALTHAGAKHIWVVIDWGADRVTVRVKDDGCGMNITLAEAVQTGHFGLLSMRERIKAHGGSFCLNSKLGQGTQVEGQVLVPSPSPALNAADRYIFDLRSRN